MADYERSVLDHYRLPSAYPTQWPAEKDQSDASEDEDAAAIAKKKSARRQSKYAALGSMGSGRKSYVPGAQKSGDGVESLARKDEPDPLGRGESVVRLLRAQGLPVQDDIELRNRFLLSSNTYNPQMYLSQMHRRDTDKELLQGLEYLTRSIDQKSASLKVLVESNFERFVKAKATIDSVYQEMKSRGSEAQPLRRRSRHSSRGSINTSDVFKAQPGIALVLADKSKNALTEQSDYGTLGIKAGLEGVATEAEEIWGPALGGHEKEQALKLVADAVERHRDAYAAASLIGDAIKRKDHESLVEEYAKAKRIADEARSTAEQLMARRAPPSEQQAQQILVAGRMWQDVEKQIEAFKREIWRKLALVQYDGEQSGETSLRDQHMELIGILLELGVDDNPISVWLFNRYDNLKQKIQSTGNRQKAEIEVLRRRLANAKPPTAVALGAHLQSLSRQGLEIKSTIKDSPEVLELWDRIYAFINSMLSSQGILGEVLDFWQSVRGFIDGKTQRTLPVGLDGESKKHHRLSDQGISVLQKGTAELVDAIRQQVYSFFADAPIEDISFLHTSASTPNGQSPRSPRSPGLPPPSPLRDPRFSFNDHNLPPPYPRLGQAWERFAFWPPWANTLSGVEYLSKLLTMLGTGASDMAGISAFGKGDNGEALERLRSLVSTSRERCVNALCASWNADAENLKVLEDWKRSADSRNITRMPANFKAFDTAVLSGLQKILYIPDAINNSAAEEVVLPPATKIVQMVKAQFMTTMYKALSGMVENAEQPYIKQDDEWNTDILMPKKGDTPSDGNIDRFDVSEPSIRKLLALSNLSAMKEDVVPYLTQHFENCFSIKLTDENKTVKDVLHQIDAKLFQSYARPTIAKLSKIIRTGITSPDWEPKPNERPTTVKPYIYDMLLELVAIHTEVTTTAKRLIQQVISYLFEHISLEILDAFRTRAKFPLSSLIQATLDVEFVAQTLSQYTTERASEIQTQIYALLDERTDNEGRVKLPEELDSMKKRLKRMREETKWEFMCFKKERKRGIPRSNTGDLSTTTG